MDVYSAVVGARHSRVQQTRAMEHVVQKIRWGMIGIGSVAEHKSGPAFARAAGGTLSAVASRRADAAADYARRHAVARAFATPAALIASAQIDAVYIATPPSSHAALALDVARAGKPCCIEKPMAVHRADAEAMRDVYAAAGLPLFVSYYRRSLPRFRQVGTWIRDGRIGPVREVAWKLQRTPPTVPAAQNWRIDAQNAPGGLFEDLACHGLDLFDLWLGPIADVDHARLSATRNNAKVPERVQARWRHGDGIRGHGDWDFAAAERSDTVVITGETGTIHLSMFDEAPIELRTPAGTVLRHVPHPVPIQLPHVEAMNAHLCGGPEHPSTADSAIRTARATDRILRGPATEAVGVVLAAPG
jgi:1,5-anhydro-D-fructose reductase (1,5-anhydro-D-mannitol-forming)